MPSIKKKGIPIVVVDIVGFTKRYKTNDDKKHILHELPRIINKAGKTVSPYGKIWDLFKRHSTGDGYYIFMEGLEPIGALEFVWGLSKALDSYNRDYGDDYPLQLRIVLGFGSVEIVEDHYFGTILSDAERLMGDKGFKTYQEESGKNSAVLCTNLFRVKLKQDIKQDIKEDARLPHLHNLAWTRCEVKDKHDETHIGYILGDVPLPKISQTEHEDVDPSQELDTEILDYRQKAESLHELVPAAGFATHIKVPIDIEDIYVPLHAMINLTGIDDGDFTDAAHAEKTLHSKDSGLQISLLEAFRQSEMRKQKGIVILGDPGSGKTTHLKRLLLWCFRNGAGSLGLPKNMLPVFLPLRDLDRLDQGLDAFIQNQLTTPHLKTPKGFGERLLERGNLLFLLDGLDEVADLSQREKVAEWIVDAIRYHTTCRFVVTCRFAGYSSTVRLSNEFLEMHIRPLTSEQVESFVYNWYTAVERGLSRDPEQAEGIAKEKANSLVSRLLEPDFRARRVFELTRNPLLLTNICLVHRHRGGLPRKRARLYEECIDVLLEHWRAAKGLKVGISAQAGRRALQPAALWLHGEEGRTRAKAEELSPHIEPVLKAINWSEGTFEDFLRTIRDDSGLLTGWDQEHYGFMHLGFQEYLAAREIRTRAFNDPGVLRELASHFGESWWQEVGLILLALEDPSLFVPYMRELLKLPALTEYPNLVEACLDDAAETSIQPFVELLKAEAGKDKGLWERQLAALKILERLDSSAVDGLRSRLEQHPFSDIHQWIHGRTEQAEQDTIISKPGGYELVRIPGGVFMMGSPETEEGRLDRERPIHKVHVPEFYMGRYPVTNQEYGIFLKENTDMTEPEYWADRRFNQPRQPVVGVSWEDARGYAKWAGLRLPTEAEWEYTCRADTSTRYYLGDTKEDLDKAGWYRDNSERELHPVGQKNPNGFGVYDMHGNVWEWVEDDWHNTYEESPDDGSAWIDEPRGSSRIFRGGGWDEVAIVCPSAFRLGFSPYSHLNSAGFRLSRSVALGS